MRRLCTRSNKERVEDVEERRTARGGGELLLPGCEQRPSEVPVHSSSTTMASCRLAPREEEECVVDMLVPGKSSNSHSLALTSTQLEMPGSIQTIDKPVVLMMAPAISADSKKEPTKEMQKMNLE